MHMTKVQQPKRYSARFRQAALLSIVALLAACAAPPKPKQFTLKGEGAQTLNRDINGRSLSVVIHIYQLKDAREFSKLTFDMLASGRTDSELLGSSLLEKSDAIVVPGGNFISTEKLRDETKFLGIVAFFRIPDPHHWRQLLDVETLKKHGLGPEGNAGASIKVQDCYIRIIDIEPVLLPGQPPNAKAECGFKPDRMSQSDIRREGGSLPPQAPATLSAEAVARDGAITGLGNASMTDVRTFADLHNSTLADHHARF
jgi:type VI secretion system protein VasD